MEQAVWRDALLGHNGNSLLMQQLNIAKPCPGAGQVMNTLRWLANNSGTKKTLCDGLPHLWGS
jgi:hypothetical protein